MYVALTRARKSLWLGFADLRMVAGRLQPQDRSSFLAELPPDCLAEAPGHHGHGHGGRGPFGHRDDDVLGFADDDDDGFAHPDCEFGGSQEPIALGPGARVAHQVYGLGTLLRLAGNGRNAKATVRFDRSGERTLLLEYAGLRLVPGWEVS